MGMMDKELGKKLISNLSTALDTDKEIDEYDFLPVPSSENKNPIVLLEHKLGIELWAVKIIYEYAHTTVLSWRQRAPSGLALDSKQLVDLSRAALMINAECAVIWNIRKELVEKEKLCLGDELYLSSLVLTKHPKSPETFAHRKWLLKRWASEHLAETWEMKHVPSTSLGGGETCSSDQPSGRRSHMPHLCKSRTGSDTSGSSSTEELECLRKELLVCRAAAERYRNNYNAWSHRIWLMQFLAKCDKQMVLEELSSSKSWLSSHISDYSGCQYRQFLFGVVLTDLPASKQSCMLKEELSFTTELMALYPGHEALWMHRRFCIVHLADVVASSAEDPFEHTPKRARLAGNKSEYLETETLYCSNILATCPDTWEEVLVKRYSSWLSRNLAIT